MKALPGEAPRCKVSVMTQAAAEITEALPFTQLQPYGDHFHPVRISELEQSKGSQLVPRGFGSPHAALTATPKVDQVRNSPFRLFSFYYAILLFLDHPTWRPRLLGLLSAETVCAKSHTTQ